MSTTTDKTYNGWTNYETWNVKLWMDNEEAEYDFWREKAQDAYDGAESDRFNTRVEAAINQIRASLKEYYEEAMCDMFDQAGCKACVWNDLLGAALSEVNWHEIATSLIDECDMEAEDIPDDFEVTVLEDDDEAESRATCGTCGRSWDDAIVTSRTPAPSGRCPFEDWH